MQRVLSIFVLFAMLGSHAASAQEQPEVTACTASGLIALRERDASIKSIYIDPDSMSVAKAETKIEDTQIRTIIMADAYLQTNKSDKPRRFLCIVGDKGKVLLTFFTQQ
ncbi:MAG: hypothetical protein K2P80_10425 [Beijerinckiaceae bacterium]|nr:hypothetical protein [Beijerinckiaceae bacterium]